MKHTLHPTPTPAHSPHSRFLLLTCALGCWCLMAGCKTLTSTRLGTHRFDGRPVEGMAYSLPMGRVEIEVVKVTTTTTPPEDAAPKPAPKPAPAPVDPAVDGLPKIPTAAEKKEKEKEKEKTEVKPIDAPPSEPQKAKGAVTTLSYKIRYKATTYVPDRSKSFAVRYKGNGMSDDTIHIKVGKNGLLDLIEVTTVDKTVDIAKKLIEIGKNIAKIAAAQAGGGVTVAEEVIFSGSFDPTVTAEVTALNQALLTVEGHPYEVAVVGRPASGSGKHPAYVSPSGQTSTITPGQAYDGVVFRPAAAYTLTLSHNRSVQQMPTVLLPDKSEMLYMPINRSAFITKVQKLDFDDGMLVDSSLTKPSEVLGGVEIPLEVTRAILALPGEIIGDNVAAMKGKQSADAQALQSYQAQRALVRAPTDEDAKDIQSVLTQQKAAKDLNPNP